MYINKKIDISLVDWVNNIIVTFKYFVIESNVFKKKENKMTLCSQTRSVLSFHGPQHLQLMYIVFIYLILVLAVFYFHCVLIGFMRV